MKHSVESRNYVEWYEFGWHTHQCLSNNIKKRKNTHEQSHINLMIAANDLFFLFFYLLSLALKASNSENHKSIFESELPFGMQAN